MTLSAILRASLTLQCMHHVKWELKFVRILQVLKQVYLHTIVRLNVEQKVTKNQLIGRH